MDDVFVEQIVKRKISGVGILIRIGVTVLAIAACCTIPILGVFGFAITALFVYLAYLGFVYTSLEYEYSFVNGELTIDKIMGKRRRKHITTYDIKNAEIIAPMGNEEIRRRFDDLAKLDYSSHFKNEDKEYGMIIEEEGDVGTFLVIIEPDERIINAMYHVRPNIVKQ